MEKKGENKNSYSNRAVKFQGPFSTYIMRVNLCQLSKRNAGGCDLQVEDKASASFHDKSVLEKNSHVEDKTSASFQEKLLKHGE